VGNPQNAYIAIASGIAFQDYVGALLPIAAASLAVGIALVALAFRRSLAAPLRAQHAELAPATIVDPLLLRGSLAILAAVFAGFLASHALGWSIAHVAFAGGLAVLALAALAARPRVVPLAKRIDGTILVFFVGLFLDIGGFREAGHSDRLAQVFLGGSAPDLPALTAWTAVLSNVVSNVPAVILIAPTVQAAGSTALWLALAASSTLAGNATLVGAAANVIVAETARAFGAEFRVRRFMMAGLPVTLATLLLMLALLGRM
jgi:Na+/H+ antiporter NhaD/arsenite permease-like protein